MPRTLWKQVSDIGPTARELHEMVYDEKRDRVVLFGGYVPSFPPGKQRAGDTWEWDGDSWTQMEDIGPSGRTQSAMAYDTTRNRVVLYGGYIGMGPLGPYAGDTWEWDGISWTQVEDSGPPPLAGHSMTYDKQHGYTLLYGLTTWAWDGTTWTQLNEIPPIAASAIITYDETHNYVILSADQQTNQPASTTWRWDGAQWKQLSDMGPAQTYTRGRVAHDGKRLVLYNSYTVETWEWDGIHWIQRQDIGPSPRSASAMVGETARQRCLLFGGYENTASAVGDTWVLSVTDV